MRLECCLLGDGAGGLDHAEARQGVAQLVLEVDQGGIAFGDAAGFGGPYPARAGFDTDVAQQGVGGSEPAAIGHAAGLVQHDEAHFFGSRSCRPFEVGAGIGQWLGEPGDDGARD